MTEGLVQGEGFAVDASIIKADANRSKGVAGTETIDWSKGEGPSRAVREYLAALDEVNQTKDDTAPAAEPTTAPKSISLTDLASRWTAALGGPTFFANSTNYLIDLHAGIILDVEATPAHRTAEVESAKTMIDRVEDRFALKPDRLAGDMAYGTEPMLGWMVEENAIAPHVLVWDKTRRDDGTFPRDDFRWDKQANEYRCPGGNALQRLARICEPLHSRHEGRHGHLSSQLARLRRMRDEE